MSGRRLLVINPGWEQSGLVDAAKGAGYELFGLTIYPGQEAVPEGFSGWRVINGRDYSAAVDFAVCEHVDFVCSTQCDYALQLQAFIAEKLGLPGPGFSQAQISANKLLQRRLAGKLSDVRQPDYFLCHDLNSALQGMRAIDGEVVVKPIDNRGSIGVSIVTREAELADAVFLAVENSISGLFLIERKIEGTLYLVEGFGPHATIVGEKAMNRDFAYMNDDILFRTASADSVSQSVSAAHEAVCLEFGFRSGLTSGEYIVNDHGVWLVEVTNRGGGVWIGSEIVLAMTGEDPSLRLLNDFAGGDFSVARSPGHVWPAAYLRYICFEPGYLSDISYGKSFTQEPLYLGHHIWQSLPARIVPASDALKRSGVLLTVGRSADDAVAAADKLMKDFEPVYEQVDMRGDPPSG